MLNGIDQIRDILTSTDEESAEVVEHGVQIAGGAKHIRPTDDQGTEAGWIQARKDEGGKVYERTVIVVDDWHEV